MKIAALLFTLAIPHGHASMPSITLPFQLEGAPGKHFYRDRIVFRGKERTRENFPYLSDQHEFSPPTQISALRFHSVAPRTVVSSRIILEEPEADYEGSFAYERTDVIRVTVEVLGTLPDPEWDGLISFNFPRQAFLEEELKKITRVQSGFLKNRFRENRALTEQLFKVQLRDETRWVEVIDEQNSTLCRDPWSDYPSPQVGCEEEIIWKRIPISVQRLEISRR